MRKVSLVSGVLTMLTALTIGTDGAASGAFGAPVNAPVNSNNGLIRTRAIVYNYDNETFSGGPLVLLIQDGHKIGGMGCSGTVPQGSDEGVREYIRAHCKDDFDVQAPRIFLQTKANRYVLSSADTLSFGDELSKVMTGAGTMTFNLSDLNTALFSYAFIIHDGDNNPYIESDRKTFTKAAETYLDLPPLKHQAVVLP